MQRTPAGPCFGGALICQMVSAGADRLSPTPAPDHGIPSQEPLSCERLATALPVVSLSFKPDQIPSARGAGGLVT